MRRPGSRTRTSATAAMKATRPGRRRRKEAGPTGRRCALGLRISPRHADDHDKPARRARGCRPAGDRLVPNAHHRCERLRRGPVQLLPPGQGRAQDPQPKEPNGLERRSGATRRDEPRGHQGPARQSSRSSRRQARARPSRRRSRARAASGGRRTTSGAFSLRPRRAGAWSLRGPRRPAGARLPPRRSGAGAGRRRWTPPVRPLAPRAVPSTPRRWRSCSPGARNVRLSPCLRARLHPTGAPRPDRSGGSRRSCDRQDRAPAARRARPRPPPRAAAAVACRRSPRRGERTRSTEARRSPRTEPSRQAGPFPTRARGSPETFGISPCPPI